MNAIISPIGNKFFIYIGGIVTGILGTYAVKWFKDSYVFARPDKSDLKLTICCCNLVEDASLFKEVEFCGFNTSELNSLRMGACWSKQQSEEAQKIFLSSKNIVLIKDGEKLVGLGNLVSEWETGSFFDIFVHSDYENKEYRGETIMNLVTKQLLAKNNASIYGYQGAGNHGVLWTKK